MNDIPRRIRIDLQTPIEAAIRAARDAVEGGPAHPHMTRATVLLGQALDAVADFVDGVPIHPAPADAKCNAPGCSVCAAGLPHTTHSYPMTAPAPADDARPMVTGGGLIKFDRPADDASGAEAMREAAAALLDGYAKNAEALAETEPEEGYEDRREEFREKAALLRAGATQIRHLPLPAPADAVEEARATAKDVVVALIEWAAPKIASKNGAIRQDGHVVMRALKETIDKDSLAAAEADAKGGA